MLGLEADVVQQRLLSVDNKIQQEQARTAQLEQLREAQGESGRLAVSSPRSKRQGQDGTTGRSQKVPVRVSSPGVVLRRGSQVEVVHNQARRYGHARDMEDDLIRQKRSCWTRASNYPC